jgi:hypothetical protein
MAKSNAKMVSAAFRDHVNAQLAHDRLRSDGYTDGEVNVLMSDAVRGEYYSSDREAPVKTGSAAAKGVGVGGAIGTAVGATVGALGAVAAGASLIAFPGLGLLVSGPLLAGLAGAGAGAVTGGVVGGLIGLGVPESNAKAYEEVLRGGGIVLGVVPHSAADARKIQQDFKELNGENVYYG